MNSIIISKFKPLHPALKYTDEIFLFKMKSIIEKLKELFNQFV
ncbi:hypothetical protein [Staphylococcus epidermidis]|nr:hypothetical protein [Staphylococcus epidermidis]EJD89372.1 hypothetical protein HMPREF9991_00845 [Staphylococcus epidermidis NIHLM067]TIC96501.1 hypothetical protein HMPREF9955_1300 [Staphylococcus epidermidis FS1]MDH9381076.1 hypothetical protein [Staphylococcus epidermidis]MDH9406093.1 hypothetical protein [Staphylococcus epidermidis]MDH9407833.1 hypothetical protein [Staphylococcus epidermidis]